MDACRVRAATPAGVPMALPMLPEQKDNPVSAGSDGNLFSCAALLGSSSCRTLSSIAEGIRKRSRGDPGRVRDRLLTNIPAIHKMPDQTVHTEFGSDVSVNERDALQDALDASVRQLKLEQDRRQLKEAVDADEPGTVRGAPSMTTSMKRNSYAKRAVSQMVDRASVKHIT